MSRFLDEAIERSLRRLRADEDVRSRNSVAPVSFDERSRDSGIGVAHAVVAIVTS